MQITFHGAAQTVTGSQHLVSLNGSRILLTQARAALRVPREPLPTSIGAHPAA